MAFRGRLMLTNTVMVLVPLVVLGVLLHRSLAARLGAQYEARVADAMRAVERGLLRERDFLGERLAALAREADADQALRLAVAGLPDRAAYPEAFAARARRLTGLDGIWLLERRRGLLAGAGEPLAAEPALLLRALDRTADGYGLLPPAATGRDSALLLVVRDSVRVGSRTLFLAGARRLDRDRLQDLAGPAGGGVTIVFPGGAVGTDPALLPRARRAGRDRLAEPWRVLPADRYWLRWQTFPRPGATAADLSPPPPLADAVVILSRSRDPWLAARRSLTAWLAAVVGVTAAAALLAALLLAVRLSRPLRELAAVAAGLDLPALAGEFPVARRDEVGEAARALDRLRDRLRKQVRELREAERRAALGDLARQVTHDLRNALVPLRNIFWHLRQVARDDPARLPRVLREREANIEAGLGYLEELADRYRRLGRPGEGRCDPASVARELAAGYGDAVDLTLPAPGEPPLPPVGLAAVDLRRVLENLVRNALQAQAAAGTPFPVRLAVAREPGGAVVVTVRDRGPGFGPEGLRRATETFYTTRPDGTGLGLAIVRRLVTDAGGELTLADDPAGGALVTVRFPPAGEEMT